jgi:hypothetical protein
MKFPKHLNLSITHNPHKNYYQTVLQYLEDDDISKKSITKEDLCICIETDELWELQWYPSSPISFFKILSYSLQRCLELAQESRYDY